jgi:hypothetical protein
MENPMAGLPCLTLPRHFLSFSAMYLSAALLVLGSGRPVQGDDPLLLDTVYLINGGEIRGKVSEIEENRQRFYLVHVNDQVVYKLKRSQVRQIVHPPEAAGEYLERLATLADTVDAHWQMQEWCQQNRMPRQREYHLMQIIRLDPEHSGARERLGYRFEAGTWIHEDHFYQNQGYVKDKRGNWRLPEAIRLAEEKDAAEQEVKNWKAEIRNLISRYQRRNDPTALAQIAQINHPAAVEGLFDAMEEADATLCQSLIEAIGQIQTANAQNHLVRIAMNTFTMDDAAGRGIREQCVRLLKQPHYNQHNVVQALLPYLRPKPDTPNAKVNLAAWIVGQMDDPSAIPALIDALNTTHTVKLGGPQGNININQGSDGMGLNMGQKPKTVNVDVTNQAALDALRLLTDSRDFGFNELAWLQWYIESRDLGIVSIGRDE